MLKQVQDLSMPIIQDSEAEAIQLKIEGRKFRSQEGGLFMSC